MAFESAIALYSVSEICVTIASSASTQSVPVTVEDKICPAVPALLPLSKIAPVMRALPATCNF